MDIRLLRHFVAVVQEEGISAAADALRMSQPALSRQMKELEGDLGVRLFERGNRGRTIMLTKEGRVFYRRARQIIELADRARAEVHMHDEVDGIVHITAAQTSAMDYVGRAAAQTRLLYPHVSFDLHDDNGPNNVERLNNGLADFAVVVQPTDMTRFDHLALPGQDRLGVGMRADDPLADCDGVTNELLKDMPLIVSSGTFERRDLSGWYASPTPLNIVGTMNLPFNASCFVREGFGYILTLDHLIGEGDDSRLVWKPLEPELRIHVSIVWRKDRELSRASQAFLRQLRAIVL